MNALRSIFTSSKHDDYALQVARVCLDNTNSEKTVDDEPDEDADFFQDIPTPVGCDDTFERTQETFRTDSAWKVVATLPPEQQELVLAVAGYEQIPPPTQMEDTMEDPDGADFIPPEDPDPAPETEDGKRTDEENDEEDKNETTHLHKIRGKGMDVRQRLASIRQQTRGSTSSIVDVPSAFPAVPVCVCVCACMMWVVCCVCVCCVCKRERKRAGERARERARARDRERK